MTNITGRIFRCIICTHGSETWGEAVFHMALHLDGDLNLAQILTTIKLESNQEAK